MRKHNPKVLMIALLVAITLGGCSDASQPSNPGPTATVASITPTVAASTEATPTVATLPSVEAKPTAAEVEAQATITSSGATGRANVLVDTAWIKSHMADVNVRLLDVSASKEIYEQGHLPGAVYVNVIGDMSNPDDPIRAEILTGEALSALLSRLGVANDDTIVLYDNTSNLDAARAYWALKYYRHKDVRIYEGGSKQWLGAGEALTTGATSVTPTDYRAAPVDPEIRTNWQYVVDSIGKDGVLLCDTRSSGEYDGSVARSGQGGHIPGAVLVEWSQAVNEDGTFRSDAQLREIYTNAGFTPDKEIVTYCQIGVRAAHTWFVLHELLSYPKVRVYDGSWEEYGSRPDSPIDR